MDGFVCQTTVPICNFALVGFETGVLEVRKKGEADSCFVHALIDVISIWWWASAAPKDCALHKKSATNWKENKMFPQDSIRSCIISRTEHHLLGTISNSFWDNLFTASRLQMQKTRILQEMMICKEWGLFRMWDKDVRCVCEHVILFCTLLTCTLVQLHVADFFLCWIGGSALCLTYL